ncbi:hypothetical protein [Thiomicrorhabdus cannonii]|uniref:hypothetical protein n=1 Tax=Thiomicrorhabdus cannonii TaxID=2748011 RepID=UPI0015BE113A|nr:hypothetical protein [Thiomicrorhabdus cannonii]
MTAQQPRTEPMMQQERNNPMQGTVAAISPSIRLKVRQMLKREPWIAAIVCERLAIPCNDDTEDAARFTSLKTLIDTELEATAP